MMAAFLVPGPGAGRVELREVDVPAPSGGDVLVRVRASGVNRGELIRRRRLGLGLPGSEASGAGSEFAGEVVAVGSGGDADLVGRRVMGLAPSSYAEYVVARCERILPVGNLTWIEAACFPASFVTAFDAVLLKGELKMGHSVLVSGGASGVGIAALRLARAAGAFAVLGTSRAETKRRRLLEIGYDAVFHPDELPGAALEATRGRGVSLVIDAVGGVAFDACIRSLALRGTYISVGRTATSNAAIDLEDLALRQLTVQGVTFRTRTKVETDWIWERFRLAVAEGVATAELRPEVHATFALADVAEAEAQLERDEHVGKIAIEVHDAQAPDPERPSARLTDRPADRDRGLDDDRGEQ